MKSTTIRIDFEVKRSGEVVNSYTKETTLTGIYGEMEEKEEITREEFFQLKEEFLKDDNVQVKESGNHKPVGFMSWTVISN